MTRCDWRKAWHARKMGFWRRLRRADAIRAVASVFEGLVAKCLDDYEEESG